MARVLVADDDAIARELVGRGLKADGHDVDVVTDGGAALDRVRSGSRYDVLVTDVEMPGVDGLALARAALALDPHLAIVVVSGFADAIERASGLNAVHVVRMTKPFSLEEIRAAVRRLLIDRRGGC